MIANKLKAFFTCAFIALLISISISYKPSYTSEAITSPTITYPPTKAPSNYKNFAYYNLCGTKNDDKLLFSYKEKENYIAIYSSDKIYKTTFNSNGYKNKTKVLLYHLADYFCYNSDFVAFATNNEIYLYTHSLQLIFNQNITNIYNIEFIDNLLYVFCYGKDKIQTFDYGKIIFSAYTYKMHFDSTFVFYTDNEVLFTDFNKKLYFSINKLLYTYYIDNQLIFATNINNMLVLTCIQDFEILFSTAIDINPTYVNIHKATSGLEIFATSDKTYKYFVCNHGDLISSQIYSDKVYLNPIMQIYKQDSYVFITTQEGVLKINEEIYSSNFYILDQYIIFEYNKDLLTTGGQDIYFAKLSANN